jgi:hypothetical protein
MSAMTSKSVRVIRDRAKRGVIDLGQRIGRLQTPMTNLLGTLRAYDALPDRMTALELFGMHGLWHTRDYARYCASLEVYEIEPVFAKFAARTLPRTEVVPTDSIRAVKTRTLRRPSYNFIVADNPLAPYGDGYIEHFDLLPDLFDYVKDEGVVIVNLLSEQVPLSEEHARRREAFYGRTHPAIDEAVGAYRSQAESLGVHLPGYVFTYRNAAMGYLTLLCRRDPKRTT